jgi:hypothetical protein
VPRILSATPFPPMVLGSVGSCILVPNRRASTSACHPAQSPEFGAKGRNQVCRVVWIVRLHQMVVVTITTTGRRLVGGADRGAHQDFSACAGLRMRKWRGRELGLAVSTLSESRLSLAPGLPCWGAKSLLESQKPRQYSNLQLRLSEAKLMTSAARSFQRNSSRWSS